MLKERISYQVSVGNAAVLPNSIQCILVDHHAGVTHDLKEGPWSFVPFSTEKEREFEIVMGTESYVAGSLRGITLVPVRLNISAFASVKMSLSVMRFPGMRPVPFL
jgi:hypothetical protein